MLNRVEELEKTVLFRVQPHTAQSPESAMKGSRAIAVVDPFSTGAVLAYEISQRGFKVYAGICDFLWNIVAVSTCIVW